MRTTLSLILFALFHLQFSLLCGATETLPPLTEGTAPQSLDDVWGAYDPTAEPLEVETIKEWEEDGVIIRAIRYYVGTFKRERYYK